MKHQTSNRFLMAGVAVVVASLVLMDFRYSGEGIVGNVLLGASILDSEFEARWPILAGFGLLCWGIYQRLNSN
jgi:hypothetical protein